MACISSLPSEIITQIVESALDMPPECNRELLLSLSTTCRALHLPALRLMVHCIKIERPEQGVEVIEMLERRTDLGKASVVARRALVPDGPFSVVSQDALMHLAPNCTKLCSPVAWFEPFDDNDKKPYESKLTSIGISPLDFAWSKVSNSGDPFVRFAVPSTYPPDVLRTSDASLRLEERVGELSFWHHPYPINIDTCLVWRQPPANLTWLSIVDVEISVDLLDWVTTPSLREVRLWRMRGVEGSLDTWVEGVSNQLVKFGYACGQEPLDAAGQMIRNSFPSLARLHLGPNAIDCLDFLHLPTTLVHLCVTLPEYHIWDGPDFCAIADVLCSGALPSLARLEMYASSRASPALDVVYPPVDTSQQAPSPLRELRLLHVDSRPGELVEFLGHVGSSLYTLALHNISESWQDLFDAMKRTGRTVPLLLRRLELGAKTTPGTFYPYRCSLQAASPGDDDDDPRDAEIELVQNESVLNTFDVPHLHTVVVQRALDGVLSQRDSNQTG
ncbi:hypothetical protein JCM1840_002747 [Sporobolomyces johnsonii]